MARPLPGLDVPVINPTGQMNQAWFEFFQSLSSVVKALGIAPASFAVSPVTPGDTTVSVTVPTLSDSDNGPGTGVPHNHIGNNNGSAQALWDSFTTIAAYNNAIRADLLASQTAVTALNDRVTELENKLNAVVTDLAARYP